MRRQPPSQGDLFGTPAPEAEPEGLRLWPDVISPEDEAALAQALATLPVKPFDFHGYLGNRRVISFGLRYDYGRGAVEAAPAAPGFLEVLKDRVAELAGAPAAAFVQALVNQYPPGAGIGWHRDKPQFGQVAGVSLLTPCVLRFRLRDGQGWRRAAATLPPRSAYLLDGPARWRWEHSIRPLEAQRWSVTFRTLARPSPDGA